MSNKEDVKKLLEAGAHFGHRTSRWNPKMRQFIYTERGGIHIIDLTKTSESLAEAEKFVHQITAGGQQVLFVGTKKHIAQAVQAAAVKAKMPYVTERWFGGILTNFDTISARIKHFKKLTAQLESGELVETYNKREVSEFQEERDKLAVIFGGIADMDKLPGAVFVADVVTETTAVKEAAKLGIPIIGVADTNADPEPIDYVIPANDDAVKTIELLADAISAAAQAGSGEFAKKPSKDKEPADSKTASKSQQPKKTTATPSKSKKTTSSKTKSVASKKEDK